MYERSVPMTLMALPPKFALLAILLVPVAMEAQAPASIGGVVFSSASGGPVAGALVLLESGQRGKTDVFGRFLLTNVVPGPQRLAIMTPGCRLSFAAVELAPDGDHRIGFEVEYEPPKLIQDSHEIDPLALVVTADEIAEMKVQKLSDVLRRTAPGMVSGPGSQPGDGTRLRGRSRSAAPGSSSRPVVVVDGVVLGGASIQDIDDIPTGNVAFIEIRRGAAGGWSYGTGGAGGVIRIQTKRGQGLLRKDPELCELPW